MEWNGVERRAEKDELKQTWWEGNNTKLWRLLLIGYMTIIGFFSSWVFTTLADIPKNYPTRSEVDCRLQKIESSIFRLGDKIDRNFKFYVQEINKERNR